MSKFKCYRSGWCCSWIDKSTTVEEFEIAKKELSKRGILLKGEMLPNNLILWPKPCPALKFKNGLANCVIYNKRPYPCRQFLCGRKFRKDERPFLSESNFNMEYFDKLIEKEPEFARLKEKMEDKAALWGKAHGWKLKKI